MGYDTTLCPDYPCLSPYCRYAYCQDYQYERDHVHPTARYHHAHTPPSAPSHHHNHHLPSHYSRDRPSSSALHEARARLRHEAALAGEIDRQNRENEKTKLEKEAREQIEHVARGKAEREKDAERGRKAREREAEKEVEKKKVKREEEERGSDGEGSECGGREYVSCRRYYRGRGEEVRFVERRYSKGRRGSVVVMTRQRAPRWLEYLM